MIQLSEYLFDNSTKYLFKRDKTYETIESSGISYYDYFLSPYGYEVIILPFYTKQHILTKLREEKFTVIQKTRGNERFVFAYRTPTVLLEVEKKQCLCIMTLFYRETKEELNFFFDYYTKQGVDYFLMYYNGDIETRKDLPVLPNVEYIQWNFLYWVVMNKRNIHHAQIPAIAHFQKKYLPYFDYALMIDVDEFLHYSKSTIKEYLLTNDIENHLFTRHNWSKIDPKTGFVKYVCHDSSRGKTILCSKKFQLNDMPFVHKQKHSVECEIDLFHNNKRQPRRGLYNKTIQINL